MRELKTKLISTRLTVTLKVISFSTFLCKMRFHDNGDHFMMDKDSIFKNVSYLEIRFENSKQNIDLDFLHSKNKLDQYLTF